MLTFITDLCNFIKKRNWTTIKLLIISFVSLIDLATDTFVILDLRTKYCSKDAKNDENFSEASKVDSICTIYNEMLFFLCLSFFLEFAKAMVKIKIISLYCSATFYLVFKSVFGALFILGEDIPQVIELFRIKEQQGEFS